QPGKQYTLAWTAVFQAEDNRQVVAFHNLVTAWLGDPQELAQHSFNWRVMDGLILVLDPDQLGALVDPTLAPQAEYYSRLLRVIEEYCAAAPGRYLPCKTAVVLVLPKRGHS